MSREAIQLAAAADYTSLPFPARVVCADPPWKFGDALPGETRGAEKNYPVLTTAEICDFPLPPVADNALLFLWRVSSMLEDAIMVAKAWGFVPKTEIVWIKKTSTGARHFGMGRIVRAEHETCLVAKRGRVDVESRNIRSTFEAKVGRHSEKPEWFYREIVERLSGGPYVELFARRRRSGDWFCFGNELEVPRAET